ncbi:MAG: hypothetical protein II919_04560 [Lachnospiraceae bacterium]|nr:hypothetical protein [Lachnospiraceae bacterium]
MKLKTEVILAGEIGVEEMDLCTVIICMLDVLIELENIRKLVEKQNQEKEVFFDIHRKNGLIRVMTKQLTINDSVRVEECKKVFNYYEMMMKPVVDKYNGQIYIREDDWMTIIVTMQENKGLYK